MHKGFLKIAAWLGALTVALGAFGAHKLKELASPETVASFDTGVRYQFYHILALILVAILHERFPNAWLRRAGTCFLVGILLFSGSIYVMTALKTTSSVGLGGLGLITPIGGVFFILGWIFIVLGINSDKK